MSDLASVSFVWQQVSRGGRVVRQSMGEAFRCRGDPLHCLAAASSLSRTSRTRWPRRIRS